MFVFLDGMGVRCNRFMRSYIKGRLEYSQYNRNRYKDSAV